MAHYQSTASFHQTLLSEIRSLRPVQNQICRLIPSTVDDKYIALPEILTSIQECFSEASSGTRQGKFAIYGIGGSGKTSLAAHYAKTWGDPQRDVIWLHGKTEDTLNTSLGEAAAALKLESSDSTMTSARQRNAVRNHLSHLSGKMSIEFINAHLCMLIHT